MYQAKVSGPNLYDKGLSLKVYGLSLDEEDPHIKLSGLNLEVYGLKSKVYGPYPHA